MIYIPTKYKENRRTLLIFHPPHPSHPIKLALRARRVYLVWAPEGAVRNWSGKALVQYVQDQPGFNFTKEIPTNEISEKLQNLLKKSEGGSILQKKSLLTNFLKILNVCSNWKKVQKRRLTSGVLKHLTFSMIFQNTFPRRNFENQIPTPLFDIKF